MEKFIKKSVAKKMIIGGITLVLSGNITILISLSKVYNKAGQALHEGSNVSLSTEQIIIDIARVLSIAGVLVLITGIILFLLARLKHK